MKLFLSWSGATSHAVAAAWRDWIPSVLQTVVPYVSSEDIDKGARWSTEISRELSECDYGILCITRSNVAAPWLNFEAGALSKSLDKGRVSPFLVGLSRAEVPPGPLLQFQSTLPDQSDVLKLVRSINGATETPLSDERLSKVFDTWWPQLAASLEPIQLAAVDEISAPEAGPPQRSSDVLIEEILELVRDQRRILASPADLLPTEYLEAVLGRWRSPVSTRVWRDLESAWSQLDFVHDMGDPKAVQEAIQALRRPMTYLLRRERPHALRFVSAAEGAAELSARAEEAEES